MKKLYLGGVLALSLMASCQQEDLLDSPKANPNMVITATLDETPASRTSLYNDTKVLWTANDALSVFNDGEHYRYILKEAGAGLATADFKYDPTFGSISGGIETGISGDVFIGVYPFAENITVSKNNEGYVVNTVIPTTQNFVTESFGQNASPMVAVNEFAPKFSFKNVGSMLIMPLKGEGIITSATLESKSHKIAGAATITAVAADSWIPTVDVTNGESKIVLSCGEGVQLNAEVATKFYFVLAPGTYEANDLTVKFTDSYGNFFETEITAENTFKRSVAKTFGERTFEAQGTEEIDLWVKAKAGAYMTAERIIPSVNTLNVEEWVKNLMAQPDTKSRLEQAVTYITMKNYEGAFNVLGGIPGFERNYKDFAATGVFYQKVDYTGASYITSMLEDIEKIYDIPSLLAFLNEFESLYEASGIKNKLNTTFENFGTTLTESIQAYVAASNEDVAQLYVDYLQSKKSEWSKFPFIGSAIAKFIDGIDVNNFADKLDGFDKWTKYLGIDVKKVAADYVVATISGLVDEMTEYSFVQNLQNAVDNPDSISSKLLNFVFSQEAFMETVKTSLHKIVAGIEEASKDSINGSNVTAKEAAISTAKTNALLYARANAGETILADLEAENYNNLNNGAWGIFKQVLAWEKTVEFFANNKMSDVYDVLVELGKVIDNMITYTRGSIYYDIEDFADYQENVDWWVVKFNEEI